MAIISSWLTHFVGRSQPTDDAQYELLLKILRDRTLGQWQQKDNLLISPGAMLISGAGSLCKNEFIGFTPVCFCDIPEGEFQRHNTVYGRFGVAFTKEFLVAKGANPVFYIAKGSLAHRERPLGPPVTLKDLESGGHSAFAKIFAGLNQETVDVRRCEFFDRLAEDLTTVLPPPWPNGTPADANDPVREVQRRVMFDIFRQVFAFMKFFDESLPEGDAENFYMEREWRVADFVPFVLDDVRTLYVAPGFKEKLEREFPRIRIKELP